MRDRVGEILKGKWRLDELRGAGGMAAVYAATHRNGSRVAVKILHPEHSADDDARQRFLREGYVANAVDHPGAVHVLDDDVTDDGAHFLVMQLLDGETLERRAERKGGRIAAADVAPIADRILDVLAAAHARGIVHRDVKPDNVFITRTGELKLLDFGIARLREATPLRNATLSGATMGTPAFMPPEQARGRWDEIDARTDVWAVGATMFTLLTGRLVHEPGEGTREQLLRAMTNAAPAVRSIAPDVPAAIAEVVDRALAFDAKDRWPDARSMQAALRVATESLRARASVQVPVQAPAPPLPDETERMAPITDCDVDSVIGATSNAPSAAPSPGPAPSARGPRGTSRRTAVLAMGFGALVAAVALALPRGAPVAVAPASAYAPARDARIVTTPPTEAPAVPRPPATGVPTDLAAPPAPASAATPTVVPASPSKPAPPPSASASASAPAGSSASASASPSGSVSAPEAPPDSPRPLADAADASAGDEPPAVSVDPLARRH